MTDIILTPCNCGHIKIKHTSLMALNRHGEYTEEYLIECNQCQKKATGETLSEAMDNWKKVNK